MKDKKKYFRFSFDTNSIFESCMNITNQSRKDNGFKPISENTMIEYMVKYYYQQKFNPEEVNRRIAQEAKYQAGIIRRSFGQYLNAILTSMDDLAGISMKNNILLKAMAVSQDSIGKLRDNSNMTQFISDMVSDEELLRKIERDYDIRIQKKKAKHEYIDFFALDEDQENKKQNTEGLVEISFDEVDETPDEYKM